MLRPGSPYRYEEVAVDMPMTSEEDYFLAEFEDVRPTDVEVLRIIESDLHVFREATMDRLMRAMVKTKAVSLLKNANREAPKGEETPFQQAVQKVVPRVVH